MYNKLINTETDYQIALARFELLFDAPIGTPASDEADILALLIDEFENKNYSIDAPDPIEAK
jgi:HTH-type transcriptional regulator/antitoxin HigA